MFSDVQLFFRLSIFFAEISLQDESVDVRVLLMVCLALRTRTPVVLRSVMRVLCTRLSVDGTIRLTHRISLPPMTIRLHESHFFFFDVPRILLDGFDPVHFLTQVPIHQLEDEYEHQMIHYSGHALKRAKYFMYQLTFCIRRGYLNNLILLGGFSSIPNRVALMCILSVMIRGHVEYFITQQLDRARLLMVLLRSSFAIHDITGTAFWYATGTACDRFYRSGDPMLPMAINGIRLTVNRNDLVELNGRVHESQRLDIYIPQ